MVNLQVDAMARIPNQEPCASRGTALARLSGGVGAGGQNSNFKTNLSPSDSDRLRFPLKIRSGHLLDHFVSKSRL